MELIRDAGIIIIIIAGLVILIRMLKSKNSGPLSASEKTAFAGTEARATILTIEQTGQTRDKLYQVKIQMQVFPEKGRNFVVEIKDVLPLDHFAILHTGVSVRVLYNPFNLKEVTLIKAA